MFQASFSLFGDWSFSLVFRNLIFKRNEQASFSLNYLLLAQPVVLVSGLEMDKLAKTQLGSLRSPTRFFCRLPPFSWDPKHDSASSTILDKMNEKLRPPLVPFQWWKKWRVFFGVRVNHWFVGGGMVLFLILFCPRVQHPVNFSSRTAKGKNTWGSLEGALAEKKRLSLSMSLLMCYLKMRWS